MPEKQCIKNFLTNLRTIFYFRQNFGVRSANRRENERGTRDGYIAKTNGREARSPIMEQGFASRRSRVRSRKVFKTSRLLLSHTLPLFARSGLAVFTLPPPRLYNSRNISSRHRYLHLIAPLAFLFPFWFLFGEMCWNFCTNIARIYRYKLKFYHKVQDY